MKQRLNNISDKIENKFPFTYIDVGAMGGIPLKWRGMLDIMNIIAFEPDPREFAKLKSDRNIKYLNYALYNRSENLKYYITKGLGRSSVLLPNVDILSQYEDKDRFRVIQEEIIPSTRVRNLDIIIEENYIQDVDFIKLDTQGSELFILQGGQTKLMPMIFGTQVEVEFIEMYKQQPVFRNIDDFLDNAGFSLMDLRRSYWKQKIFHNYRGKGQLVFGDALYFKKINVLYQELSKKKDIAYGKSKIIKSILICIVYKMFDYAIAIAEVGLDLGYLNRIEYETVTSSIKRTSPKGFFLNSYFYARIHSKISRLFNKLKPRSYLGWADGDREIGNTEDI